MTFTVGTHNGNFHADEVLACAMLKLLKHNVIIIRTRDSEILDGCDCVVDVGGKYDPDNLRFDHHQKGCFETFEHPSTEEFDEKSTDDSDDWSEDDESSSDFEFDDEICLKPKIPLSSAGMVYKHYGKQLISTLLLSPPSASAVVPLRCVVDVNENLVEKTYTDLYYQIIQEVDANDNGVPAIRNESQVIYNYRQWLHFGQLVRNLNGPEPSNDLAQQSRFEEAVNLATKILKIQIFKIAYDNHIYSEHIEDFINDLKATPKDSPILVLTNIYPEWRKYLSDFNSGKLTKHNNLRAKPHQFKFTVYPRNSEKTEWGFGTVPVPGQRFVNQIDLLPYDVLRQPNHLLFPEELIFVHKNLFCGSAITKITAIDACLLSYKANRSFRFRDHLESIKYLIGGLVILGAWYFTIRSSNKVPTWPTGGLLELVAIG